MAKSTALEMGTKAIPPQTFPIVETQDGPQVHAFGHYWPFQDDISLHLNAFRLGLDKDVGGLGKLTHLVIAHNLLWPQYSDTLHRWTVDRFRAFCEGHKVITMASGASTAKSADAARYALLWWLANPAQRTALICSTTLSALTKRIWSYITTDLYKIRYQIPGIVSNSPPPKILFNRNDQKHGIHGVPLKEGQSERTLADVIGIHPEEGMLVIIDEMTDVTPGIIDAIPNWDSGKIEFQMIGIGNSKSRLDPHGRLSEPLAGWNSVDPDIDERWETKMGVCLYFDCYKSPAILDENKDKLPFLINAKKIKAEEKRLGKDDPKFWRFVRGFWPPDDMLKTVLTLSMVDKHRCRDSANWEGSWQITIAALDPAFTSEGDECILRFGKLGLMTNGLIGLDLGGERGIVSLQLDARATDPINYQIIRAAKRECEARGVLPHRFGADTWGIGMGAGDIFQKEWSPEIHRVLGIGLPSERLVDSEAGDRACDIYDRQITEMWFNVRSLVQAGQIFGLDSVTIEEFCSRQYAWKGRKLSLESKKEFKQRMGREDSPTGSPDRGDAAAILVEVAMRLGLAPGGRVVDDDERSEWESRWEGERHAKSQPNQDWQEDSILDSASFSDPWE